MKDKLFVLFLFLFLFMTACSEHKAASIPSKTDVKPVSVALSQAPIDEAEVSSEAQESLKHLRDELQNGQEVKLSDIKKQFKTFIDRDSITDPYLKITESGKTCGFVFYGEHDSIKAILVMEHLPSWDDFSKLEPDHAAKDVAGFEYGEISLPRIWKQDPAKTTMEDIERIDPNSIPSPISIACYTGHLLQEGFCITRCEWGGLVLSEIEFIPYEEADEKTLNSHGMKLWYILPEDRF